MIMMSVVAWLVNNVGGGDYNKEWLSHLAEVL